MQEMNAHAKYNNALRFICTQCILRINFANESWIFSLANDTIDKYRIHLILQEHTTHKVKVDK